MLAINATVRAQPGKGDECAAELARTAATRQKEEGLFAWIVTRSGNDPELFHIVEVYRDNDALAEHLRISSGDEHRRALSKLVAGPPDAALGSLVGGVWKLEELDQTVLAEADER